MFQYRPKSIGDKYRREIHWLNRKIKTKGLYAFQKAEILERISWLKKQLKTAQDKNREKSRDAGVIGSHRRSDSSPIVPGLK